MLLMTPMLSLAQFQEKVRMEVILNNTKMLIEELDTNIFATSSKTEMLAYTARFLESLKKENGFEIKFVRSSINFVFKFDCEEFSISNRFVIECNLNHFYEADPDLGLIHEYTHINQARLIKIANLEICPLNEKIIKERERAAWNNEYYAMIIKFDRLKGCYYSNGKYFYENGDTAIIQCDKFKALIQFHSDEDNFLNNLYGFTFSVQK